MALTWSTRVSTTSFLTAPGCGPPEEEEEEEEVAMLLLLLLLGLPPMCACVGGTGVRRRKHLDVRHSALRGPTVPWWWGTLCSATEERGQHVIHAMPRRSLASLHPPSSLAFKASAIKRRRQITPPNIVMGGPQLIVHPPPQGRALFLRTLFGCRLSHDGRPGACLWQGGATKGRSNLDGSGP